MRWAAAASAAAFLLSLGAAAAAACARAAPPLERTPSPYDCADNLTSAATTPALPIAAADGRPLVLSVVAKGEKGNRYFQLAFAVVLARRYGLALHLPAEARIDDAVPTVVSPDCRGSCSGR